MNIPSIKSIAISSQVKKQLEGLIVDNFDGKSKITIDDLYNFIEQKVNSLYSDTFGENLPLLSDDKLQKIVNEYNDCIIRSGSGSFMNDLLNIQDAQHRVNLFIQSFFISKMVSNKLDKNNSENKEKIHTTLSDYPEKTDYTLIGFGDQGDDKGPKGPSPHNTNFRNRTYEKIKLDIDKLDEDHSILQTVISIFTGKYRLSAGRHELHGGKVIATVKEEKTSSGIIKSTSVDYKLAYDYNNPSKYKDFLMLAALTLEGKTVNINPRNRNAELRKLIKLYTV